MITGAGIFRDSVGFVGTLSAALQDIEGKRLAMFKDVRVDPQDQATREELAESLAELGIMTKEQALQLLPPDSLPQPSQH